MELLKQPQYTPYPVEDQVASIWAGTHGKLDRVPVADVRRFETEMLEHLRRHTDVLTTIATTGLLTDETEAALETAIDEFASAFVGGGDMAEADVPQAAEPEADVAQEQIVKQKRG
jgi:F-type H+-transporting ATPase subunit alpha